MVHDIILTSLVLYAIGLLALQARLPEIDTLQERLAALEAELTQAKTQAEEQGRASELREKELADAKSWLESQVRLIIPLDDPMMDFHIHFGVPGYYASLHAVRIPIQTGYS